MDESNLVTHEGSRVSARISWNHLLRLGSMEIVLAKIVCGGYIGFTCFIRYSDV